MRKRHKTKQETTCSRVYKRVHQDRIFYDELRLYARGFSEWKKYRKSQYRCKLI